MLELYPDPWDEPYRLAWDGDRPRVSSCGPDRIAGTGDDIVYPVPE